MDVFGIGAAISAMVDVYSMSSRQSGRTTALVESAKDGDRIYFLSARDADNVRRLCFERNVAVECLVRPASEVMPNRGTAQGRTMFDHRWVEQYYRDALSRAQKELHEMEQAESGYGAPHRETRRKALEIAKWR
jgi:hypothetical protein